MFLVYEQAGRKVRRGFHDQNISQKNTDLKKTREIKQWNQSSF